MKGYDNISKQALMIEIEKARHSMIMIALKEGLTSDNTIKASQSIDYLLNKLEKISD